MSHDSYNRWWITSKRQLEDLRVKDLIIQSTTKPTKERNVANQLVGGLYARYSLMVQDLAACLDQNCLIQKRFTMRKLVDAATMRLNEFKEELTKINMSEYHYIDGNLVELKLIPHDVQILDPALVYDRSIDIEDLWTRIKNGETIYVPPPPPPEPEVPLEEGQAAEASGAEASGAEAPAAGTEAPPADGAAPAAEATPAEGKAEGEQPAEGQAPTEGTEAPKEGEVTEQKKKKRKRSIQKYVPPQIILTPEEIAALERQQAVTAAVLLIQTNERARQCRLYYGDLDIQRSMRKRAAEGPPILPDAEPEIQETAATNIQRLWRGHTDRQYMKRCEKQRRLLIGMTDPSWTSTAEQAMVRKTIDHRRAIRDQHIREYIQANLDEKERVLRVMAPGLFEDIGDEIREWFYQWYIRAKNFDKYPPEEQGGSILIVRGETMTPEEWLDDVEKKRREKAKQKGRGGDKNAEKEKKKKAEAEKKKKAAEAKKKAAALAKKKKNAEFEFVFEESIANTKFNEGFKEYHEIWDERPFEENLAQKHYMDIIHEQKCYEVQLEVRPQVDQLMILELDLLNDALEHDKWKAKGKKGKPKPKKKKKGKKGKKGKKKGKKDPTGNRSTEDLFQELVDNGIIHTYPEAHIKDYIGDFSYCNWEKRNLLFDPPATLGDVRQAVTMNCILPLGVETMVKPKSVLIAGHRQSGKHLLANAVFYETRCVLFDLSPPVLAGKYPGKKGMKMLLHLIGKMSRLLQPSVIFFDGGEKPFYKKVPKQEKALEPKKMGKKLFKGIIKPITPEDKVLVLAITGQPFAAKAGKMNKAFEKIILIPQTDYGSVYLYWRELLMAYHGVDRDFNVTEVAKISVTYPLPVIKEAAERVLIPSRIIQLKYRPLDAHEILDALISGPEAVIEKEWKKFEKWFKKTPLAKKRGAYMKIAEKIREAEAKAAEKAKAKK